jgi:hypothetical protein
MPDGLPLTPPLLPRLQPLLVARTAGLAERTPADLSAANLWLFRQAHGWRWHEGAWPCVAGHGYGGEPVAIPLFDPASASDAVLADLLARHGSLAPLRDAEAQALGQRGLRIDADRDEADYVYTGEQFRRYPGRALHNQRNLVAQHLAAGRTEARPYGAALQEAALAVLDGWLVDKSKRPGEADDLPCREALAHADALGLGGFVHFQGGEPVGFLLAQAVQHGVWAIRFAKGLARCTGVSAWMFQHFAHSAPQPVDWMNFEQDLGLPNFRRTKLGYQPAFLLPKWRARATGVS